VDDQANIDDSFEMAKAFYEDERRINGIPNLWWWRRGWYGYEPEQGVFQPLAHERLRNQLNLYLRSGNIHPTSRFVSDIIEDLKGIALLEIDRVPAWTVDPEGRPDPAQLLVAENGILDLTNLGESMDSIRWIEPTPALFTLTKLPFAFDPSARAPRFRAFLNEVSGGDAAWIETLLQILGYLLLPTTHHQKIFLFVGPKRSGKGTILRVIGDLVGEANCCSPTLVSLSGTFGLAPLVGKLVALCGDEHFAANNTQQLAVIETLKRVSGEDMVDINRKYKEQVAGVHLIARFVIAANEIPDLPDASSALTSRFIALFFPNSFFGKEDPKLGETLRAERDGIAIMAIQGLISLRKAGRFVEPPCSADLRRELGTKSAPVEAFISECCALGKDREVASEELYARWKSWCEDHSLTAGSAVSFGLNLRILRLPIQKVRRGSRNDRCYSYEGIGLKPRKPRPSSEKGSSELSRKAGVLGVQGRPNSLPHKPV
jgi:putative DNA primase/helicase